MNSIPHTGIQEKYCYSLVETDQAEEWAMISMFNSPSIILKCHEEMALPNNTHSLSAV